MGGYFAGEEEKTTTTFQEVEGLEMPLLRNFRSTDQSFYSFKLNPNHIDKVSTLKNYGVLPVEVFHSVFVHLELRDVLDVMCSCKLFYVVVNNNYFWETYFHNWKLSLSKEVSSRVIYEEDSVTKNFKNRVYGEVGFTAKFYKKKYKLALQPTYAHFTAEFEKYHCRLRIFVYGENNSGNDRFSKRFMTTQYEEDLIVKRSQKVVAIAVGYVGRINRKRQAVSVVCHPYSATEYKDVSDSFIIYSQCGLAFFSLTEIGQFERSTEWLKNFIEVKKKKGKSCRCLLVGTLSSGKESKVQKPVIQDFLKSCPSVVYFEMDPEKDDSILTALCLSIDFCFETVRRNKKVEI